MSTDNGKPKPIHVVAVGDIHAGSIGAVCLPVNELKSGMDAKASPAQMDLYRAWEGLTKEWGEPDALIVNGDAIEGNARKASGVGTWSTDLDDQLHCAAELVRMWNAKKIFVTEGTGYHVDAAGKSLEHWLGKLVGAETVGPRGAKAWDGIFVRFGKLVFNAAHHISMGTGWYKSTAIMKELLLAELNKSDFHHADVLIRSHVHYHIRIEDEKRMGVILPCWQLATRYMRRKSYLGAAPTIGAVRFTISPDGNCDMEKRTFPIEAARPKLIQG